MSELWLIPPVVGLASALVILVSPIWFLRMGAAFAMKVGGASRDDLYQQALPVTRPLLRVAIDREAMASLTRRERITTFALISAARVLGAFGVTMTTLVLINGL